MLLLSSATRILATASPPDIHFYWETVIQNVLEHRALKPSIRRNASVSEAATLCAKGTTCPYGQVQMPCSGRLQVAAPSVGAALGRIPSYRSPPKPGLLKPMAQLPPSTHALPGNQLLQSLFLAARFLLVAVCVCRRCARFGCIRRRAVRCRRIRLGVVSICRSRRCIRRARRRPIRVRRGGPA